MFRKQEDAAEEWSPENVAMCGRRQDEILEEAYGMLLPGGRLVYSTCTFAPEENEGSISRFLYAHPDMHILPVQTFPGMTGGRADWYQQFATHTGAYSDDTEIPVAEGIRHTLRLFPHQLEGEGHFVAVLQKEGEANPTFPTEKTLAYKDLPELKAFAKNVLTEPEEQALSQGRFLKFGDQVYLVPPDTPKLKGLKVLRPGLHLGTVKKNRLEPSHAWALALQPEKVQRVCALTLAEDTVHHYLNGETFTVDTEAQGIGENGWCLITIDGFSIGWGKLTGTTMKNHYPKGLRKHFNHLQSV
jgi:NOL1/NOP2/fmu family ribosome biogenesis protein